jgi:N-methylhydantoinase B
VTSAAEDLRLSDPVTFTVFMNRLNRIVEHMTITLENTAMTPIISQVRDFACAVYDAKCRQLAMVDGVPVHAAPLDGVLKEVMRRFDGAIHDGDVFLVNDPYAGNTHNGDLVCLVPAFAAGELTFWAVISAHQLDFGTPSPASGQPWAADVYQEGLTIPPIKIVERGVERRDVIELYLANVRWRDLLYGDLMAEVGAAQVGRRMALELCDQYGLERTRQLIDAVIEYGRERTAAEFRALPDGTYTARGWFDSDGLGRRDIPINVTLTVTDDHIQVDFAGSAPQVDTGVNSSRGIMRSAGVIPLIMTLPSDVPHNQGCLDQVSVSAPEGSICNATWPHSTVSGTVLPGDAMQDVVWKAIAQAAPDAVRAGTARWNVGPMLAGGDPGGGDSWGHLFTNCAGGGGAAKGYDGWPLICSAGAEGAISTPSVEETEMLVPILVEHCELHPDSMGLGQWIGGPGVTCSVRPMDGGFDVFSEVDSQWNPPFGLFGATGGSGSAIWVQDEQERRHFLPPTSVAHVSARERWACVSTGGGGYGPPLARPIEQVERDVRDGLISRGRAAEVYGVIVSDDAARTLDENATAKARAEISARPRPIAHTMPDYPGAANLAEELRQPGDVIVASPARYGMEGA